MSAAESPPPLRVVGPTASPAGDWETLYRAHVVPLYRFVYARTGNTPDAEDVTSAAFIRALPRLRPDVSDGEIRAYLRNTARTVLADLWRQRHGVIEEELDEGRLVADPAEPSGEVDLSPLLDRLPPNYRQVLELRFLRGYTIKETAAAMEITTGNAKVLQLRALRRAASLEPLHVPS